MEQHFVAEVQPELVVHQGNASNCILAFAEKENMEGMVMGKNRRRGFDRLTLRSTTDRGMREAACPMLVVLNPALCDEDRPRWKASLVPILHGTDFSYNFERARGYAVSWLQSTARI